MRFLRNLWFRIRAAIRPRTMERELRDEFAFHLEMESQKLRAQGMSPGAAEREAARRFGGQVAQRELARDSWGIGLLSDFVTDLRHTMRQLRRSPGFSILGILTLALGLGATVGLAGVVRSVLFQPLPFTDERNIREFWSQWNWRGEEFDYLKERSHAFTLAAYSADGATLRTATSNSVMLAGVVSAETFDVLGARPLMGRTFRAGEDRPGAERVVVLSWGLWQKEMGGNPDIVGTRINLDGAPATVVGVMPRTFYFPTPEYRLWRPVILDPADPAYHGNGWLVLVGRVRAGVNEAAVAQDVQAMARALGERYTYPAAWDKTKGATVTPIRETLVGDSRPALLLLLGAGILLLLMACANVAALILARTTDRSQEIALRAALGAGRGRLARQILTESLTFSVLAGGLGLLVSGLGFRVLVASLPLQNGLEDAVRLDWTAFAIALALSALVGVSVAAVPVRNLLRGRLQGLRNERGSRGMTRGTSRVHSALVGAEASIAVLLVAGAMLLIRSVGQLFAIDLGFTPHGVLAIDVIGSGADWTDPDRIRLYREVEQRAAAIPGVTSTGMIGRLPIRDGGWQGTVNIVGVPELSGKTAPNSYYRPVTPGYFATMGHVIARGRPLQITDRKETAHVALVSESFAAKAWPGVDPLGRQVRSGIGGDTAAITIVGVVKEAKVRSISGANPFVLYVPQDQAFPIESQVLLLKTTGKVDPIVAAVRQLVREVEPRAAIGRVTTMDAVVDDALAEWLRLRFFLSLFGGIALVLGAVGVYSVVSYSVARRQTEFGVRLALGATPSSVLRQVVGKGLVPIGVGTVVGVGLALGLARMAARFLYGVGPADPVSMGLSATVLLGSGVLAALLPAWRAARVSPVESLRAE